MKYFVRMRGRPPFHGPYDEREIASRLRTGEFAGTLEVVDAVGQTERQLVAATDWRVWRESLPSSSEETSSTSRKWRYLQDVRATTCYPRLRVMLAVLTGFAIVIEAAVTFTSLSAARAVSDGLSIPPSEIAAPVLVTIVVCTLELLFTLALYGLVRTVIDLADLALHRDARTAES
jgi:hypothetical protein